MFPEGPPKGGNWTVGSGLASLYNHAMIINEPTCYNTFPAEVTLAITAGSLHPGGANVLFADGHVKFTGDSIARRVWHAIGTAAGGEIATVE